MRRWRRVALRSSSPQTRCEPAGRFFLAAVAFPGFKLRFAAEVLRADRDFPPAAVAQTGIAPQFASVELRARHEVVVGRGAGLLRAQFASKELRADLGIVRPAVAQNAGTLEAQVRLVTFPSWPWR